jgi:Manganese containing catalase
VPGRWTNVFPIRNKVSLMYHHIKKIMFTVRVDEPGEQFGKMLLEQFGGANGWLAAAMQYPIRRNAVSDPRTELWRSRSEGSSHGHWH